jgi:2-C-methyl-D-erythritol 4-phosphate cytidylyltransferase
MSSHYLIIVAGGSGSRMKSDVPKQFLSLAGKPLIIHTLKKFIDFDKNMKVVIAVHKNYLKHMQALAKKYFPENHSFKIVEGGETRFHSVKNALAVINDDNGLVAIHDAARPFVSEETIKRSLQQAAKYGNAIPAVAVNESIRLVKDRANKAVNRSHYRIIQTPQCFKLKLIKKAFTKRYSTRFTDDASVLESCGQAIHLVEGNYENIKITNPGDLLLAKVLLKNEQR